MNTYQDLIQYVQPRRFSEGGDTSDGGDTSEGGETAADAPSMNGLDSLIAANNGFGTVDSPMPAHVAEARRLADATGVNDLDSLIAVTNGFDTMGPQRKGDSREVSPGGLTYGTTRNLQTLGYGRSMGVNPNNPTQSASEALNAKAFEDYVGKNIGTVMGTITGSPVVGTLINMANEVAAGKSFGDALANAAVGAVAPAMSKLLGVAVPAAAVSQAIRGNLPGAVQSAITANITRSLGIPPGSVASALRGDMGAATAQAATSIATRELTQNPLARTALTKALEVPGKGFAAGGAVGDNVANTLLAMGTPSADLVAYLNKRG